MHRFVAADQRWGKVTEAERVWWLRACIQAAFSGKWMPAKQKAAAVKAPKRSAEESEEEEEGEGEGDAGGHLEDIVMSDDSDDSDDEPPAAAPARPKPNKAAGRKPGVKGKGGGKPKSSQK